MKRKEFLQKAGMLTAAGSMGVNLISCGGDDGPGLELSKPIDVDLSLSLFEAISQEGGWMIHPDVNVLMLNVNNEIRAFSSVCPHQQCTRNWSYNPGVFICTCHDSRFDSTGQFLSGPANDNLRELSVTQEGTVVTIS